MGFRRDINGLRALAVAAVVLFHFNVQGFSGGFVGVDIFFVISGYLMTSLIFGGLSKNRFSLIDFYLSRGRRIIPALATLCVTLIIIGWWLLLPTEYASLGKQVAGSIGFFSNLIFWKEAGYFDVSAHEKWLLHTWSLSVEWQFYMLYPLIVVGLRKLTSRMLTAWILIGGMLLSLLLSSWMTTYWPGAAFYMLPTRAWEMMAGGMLYLFPVHIRSSRLLEGAGLAVIAGSILTFNPATPWPGSLAVFPVLGTALVIAAGRQDSWLTSNAVSQWLGKISYSVYLWHWPIVVGLKYFEKSGGIWIVSGIMASLMLGQASFRFVETPLSGWGKGRRSLSLTLFFGTASIIALLGTSLLQLDGVPSRVTAAVQTADRESLNRNPARARCFTEAGTESPKCLIGDVGKSPAYIFMGDSHALSTVSAAATALADRDGPLVFMGYSACPAILGVRSSSRHDCEAFIKKAFRDMDARYSGVRIIIVNRAPEHDANGNLLTQDISFPLSGGTDDFKASYRRHYLDSMCKLAEKHEVYATLPIPEFSASIPKALGRKLMHPSIQTEPTLDIHQYQKENAFIIATMKAAQEQCGIHLLDPTEVLCEDGKCLPSEAGRPLYYDNHHLSEYGNQRLIPLFEKIPPLRASQP